MAIEMIEDKFNAGTHIKVIGVGGGGGNAVNHMIASKVQGVEFICANTDAQALSRMHAETCIQLGTTGLGAGSNPTKGREAAEAAADEIRQTLSGAHMVFITAGMGGGTGTGAAPVIARIAKDMGILTVAVVTKPSADEGRVRMSNAEDGLAELEENVDSMIVVLNEKLYEVLDEDVTELEAFAAADDVLRNAVGGISDIINFPGLVNVDFEDVRTVMGIRGKAMMGMGSASGPDRARIAAEQAIACPLLDGVNLSGAKGVLVYVISAPGAVKMREVREIANTVTASAAPDVVFKRGSAYDESMGDEIRVIVIATGLSNPGGQQRMTVVPGGLRTGTDNLPFSEPAMMVQPVSTAAAVAAPVASAPRAGAPRVWSTRGDRNTASSRVGPLGGMDEVQIPAFLRQQAD